MKSWKLVCLMLVFVLMLAVFAGCSGGDSAEQESNTGETAPPTSQVWTRDRFTVAAQPKDLRYENGNLLVDATVASGIDTVDEDGNPNDGVKYFENIRFDVYVTMKKDVTDEEEKGEEMKVLPSRRTHLSSRRIPLSGKRSPLRRIASWSKILTFPRSAV